MCHVKRRMRLGSMAARLSRRHFFPDASNRPLLHFSSKVESNGRCTSKVEEKSFSVGCASLERAEGHRPPAAGWARGTCGTCGAMGIIEEYSAIAEGMRNGSLPPAGEDHSPPLWISKRFANSQLSTSGPGLAPGFGEQFDASLRSSVSYSFGNCSRKDATKVYVSRELSKGEDISPGPLAYKIPTNMGPDGSAKTVVNRSPMVLFGTDIKNSAELRELKASGVYEGTSVAGDLKAIRDRVHDRVYSGPRV